MPSGGAARVGGGRDLPYQAATGLGAGGRRLAAGALGERRRGLRSVGRLPGRGGSPGPGLHDGGAGRYATLAGAAADRRPPVPDAASRRPGARRQRPHLEGVASRGSLPGPEVWLVLRRPPGADPVQSSAMPPATPAGPPGVPDRRALGHRNLLPGRQAAARPGQLAGLALSHDLVPAPALLPAAGPASAPLRKFFGHVQCGPGWPPHFSSSAGARPGDCGRAHSGPGSCARPAGRQRTRGPGLGAAGR